jgi:hypothetical protein
MATKAVTGIKAKAGLFVAGIDDTDYQVVPGVTDTRKEL